MNAARTTLAAAVLAALTLAPVGAPAAKPRCFGHPATVVGTAGDDVLTGTKHRDFIAALGGDDAIGGLEPGDRVCGGDGSDTVSYADAAAGVTVDLASADVFDGVENLVGSPFADTLRGDDGDNVLTGGAGDDVLDGRGGTDLADFSDAPAGVTVDLAAGRGGGDVLVAIEGARGSPFDDDLFGDDGANELEGGAGADLIQSFGGDDTLAGGAGDDTLRGGDGTDAADGGDGTDACVDVDVRSACERGGGTLTVLLPIDPGSLDPALDYVGTGWQIEYATCLKLVNYADDAPSASQAVPLPEAAPAPLVSADGRTYTFTIRDGLRFSPPSNEVVTAATFKHVFERIRSPLVQSPAVPFVSDVTGVDANGQTLTVTLANAAPDFLARLAMPFFCAVPQDTRALSWPGVETPASAGPYVIASRVVGSQTELVRNPSYRGRRPSNFDRIVYRIGDSLEAAQLAVESGTADYAAGGIPEASYAAVNDLYGPDSPAAAAGRQRFFVNPQPGFRYVALNTSRPLFANPVLRRAVATALDRNALVAVGGALQGTATDQYLSPGVPGYVDEQIYPLGGDLDAARALAASQGVTPATPVSAELYASFGVSRQRAELIRSMLAQIGIDVTVHVFSRAEQIQREGTPGEPFDLTVEGWILDYNDPFDVINLLLYGGNIRACCNNNVSYFDDPAFNARMEAASQLSGQARYDAYAALEHDLVRAAPLVAFSTLNSRDYFTDRIGCQQYGIFGMNLGALCVR